MALAFQPAASVLLAILRNRPGRIAEDGGIVSGINAAGMRGMSLVINDRTDRTLRATRGGAMVGGVR